MTKNRIEGLDIIRSLAIFCIILAHSIETNSPVNSIEEFNNLSAFAKALYFSFYAIGRIGVPLFFILSGYLLLPRNFDSLKTKQFYKNNFLPLLLAWELWIPANNWLATWFLGLPFHTSSILKEMFFIERGSIPHSWYMPVILGIYLFVPYISRVLKTISNKEFLLPMSIVYIYLFVIPTINSFKLGNWVPVLDLSFSGGLYGTYVILGYLLYRFTPKPKSSLKLILFILISIALTTYAEIYFFASKEYLYPLWYEFFLIPPTAIAIFVLFRDVKINKIAGLVERIAKCSFGMYLIHVFFIAAFLKFEILSFIINDEFRGIILTLLVYVLSFIAVMLIKKLPYIGKILVR